MRYVLTCIGYHSCNSNSNKRKPRENKIKLGVKYATKSQKVSEKAAVLSNEEPCPRQNLPGQVLFVDIRRLSVESPLSILVA